MQLTSKDGNMVVDFYPVKFATGQIHNRLMLKVVTFMGKLNPRVTSTKKDFQYEFDSRTHGYGYQVTDESMLPQLFNSAMGMACDVICSTCYYHHLLSFFMTATLSQTDLIVKYANALCVAASRGSKRT